MSFKTHVNTIPLKLSFKSRCREEKEKMINPLIDSITKEQLRNDLPDFQAGDNVRVHAKIVEGDRERIQIFEGVVIKRQGSGIGESYTVRKISNGVGVERTFPLHSPRVEEIEVTRQGRVRRSRLYYLRDRQGRAARIREKDTRNKAK